MGGGWRPVSGHAPPVVLATGSRPALAGMLPARGCMQPQPAKPATMGIAYDAAVPTAAELGELYAACTLGGRRPLQQPGAAQAMLDAANIREAAREDGRLVGFARAWTDRVHVTYLADLAVRESHQRHGIGRELIRRVQAAAPQALVVLIAAPQAHEYYGRIGFAQHRSCWILRPGMAV